MNFKLFVQESADDMFGDDDFDISKMRAKIKARGSVVDVKQESSKSSLEIYHGFNNDPEQFNYEFDPKRSEQGLLWFTHKYIRGYDPKQYAKGKGRYLLTINIPITKHWNVVTYEDGTSEKIIQDELRNLSNPVENSPYLLSFDDLIELPNGWFFTYKHEKFIGATQKFTAQKNQITEV